MSGGVNIGLNLAAVLAEGEFSVRRRLSVGVDDRLQRRAHEIRHRVPLRLPASDNPMLHTLVYVTAPCLLGMTKIHKPKIRLRKRRRRRRREGLCWPGRGLLCWRWELGGWVWRRPSENPSWARVPLLGPGVGQWGNRCPCGEPVRILAARNGTWDSG